MNFLKIFPNKEKQRIIEKLNSQFGIKDVYGIISRRGKDRLFLFQGDYDDKEIKELERTLPLERIGTYFAKLINDEIRLSIEGVQLLKDQITKNIFELTNEQANEWMKGNELNLNSGLNGFVVMKHNEDYLGCGKASKLKITNFIPKNRRLRK